VLMPMLLPKYPPALQNPETGVSDNVICDKC
jgi:hypothetical protein